MIYTITFNPSLDYVVTVENFETEKVNRTTSEFVFPGGKGINVSMVLSELGVENTALGFVAGFTGAELERQLKDKGAITDFVSVKEGNTRINVKLRSTAKKIELNEVEVQETENSVQSDVETEINGAGPIVSEEELKLLLDKLTGLNEKDIVVISGSVSKGISQSVYADIVKLCNERNIKVVVDAASSLLWNTLEYEPFLIKPNKDELEDIFYRDLFSKEEVEFYAKELQNRGAKNVLVSLGEHGAVLVAENGEVYDMDAPQGEVLNSVGAGDSMVAGFLAGYLETNDFENALKLGICAGSATAFSYGLATKTEIDKLLLSE
ncbi:MAG: 1-phosphofructokinase family hexose kinase [Agathobacter sp.]|nr:1-phosphofructokinase family hexose kinase [Agathobacter sp.]